MVLFFFYTKQQSGYETQNPLEHAQRHLAFGLGSGIPYHGHGLLHPLFETVAVETLEMKRLHDKTNMLLKSLKQYVHSSYPVGLSMYVKFIVLFFLFFFYYFPPFLF